jgi:hypothetical protein
MGTNQLDAAGRPLDQFLIHFAMSELVGSAAVLGSALKGVRLGQQATTAEGL